MAMKAFQGFSRLMEPTYEVLDPQNTNQLQEIMFAGEPWVVFCGRKIPNGRVNNTYEGRVSVMNAMVMDKLAVQAKGRFRVGLLDCSATLPSGKNLYERFKLKPKGTSSQIAFWVANGGSPRVMDPSSFRSTSDYDVARLATRIAKQTELKADLITSTKQLTKKCVEYKRGCIVIVNKGHVLAEGPKKDLATIMQKNRKLRYFILDITKRQISLHLPPAMMGYPQVVMVRKTAQGEGVDKYYEYTYSVFDDEFEAKEVMRFISDGLAASPKSDFWSTLTPLPRISKISPPPGSSDPAKKKASPKGPSRTREKARMRRREKQMEEENEKKRQQKAADAAKAKEGSQESDEELYKRRRKKMDEEILESVPMENEDYEEMDQIEEAEEEEVIDLDDTEDVVEIHPDE